MKFLILNADYLEFLRWLYAEQPGLERKSYEEQMLARNESLFGVADFYSSNLRKLGHHAWDIHVNNHLMQAAWARENGVRSGKAHLALHWRLAFLKQVRCMAQYPPLRQLKGLLRPLVRSTSTSGFDIIEHQIRHYRPDVLLNQAVDYPMLSRFLRDMKKHVPLMIGQIASQLPADKDFSVYDLMISSLPHYLEFFRSQGIPAESHKLGFETAVQLRLSNGTKKISLSFVGSLLERLHADRIRLLEYLSRRFDLKIFGPGVDSLPATSPIRQRYFGPVWGQTMYQTLIDSRITLNNHSIDVSGRYANNMRLFEATGVGTCLVTDHKDNLAEMFEPDREVVTYQRPDECAEKVGYLLEHDGERAALASAGQRRTLREHTYYHRMQELVEIVDGFRGRQRRATPSTLRRLSRRAAPLLHRPSLRPVRERARRFRRSHADATPTSYGYEIIGSESGLLSELSKGWQDAAVPRKQQAAFEPLLRRMREGNPREDFIAVAKAVEMTGLVAPGILEVGCGSGWNYEVLTRLLNRPIRYLGLDYSMPMARLGRHTYRAARFIVGDAARLPLGDGTFDIVLSGTVLMHLAQYREAIRESRRVARSWCIFHTVTVAEARPTTMLKKFAYGSPVVEVVFNEEELRALFSTNGLKLRATLESIPYDLAAVLGEPTKARTYVCETA